MPSGVSTLYVEVGAVGGGGPSTYAGNGGAASDIQTCSKGGGGCAYTSNPDSDPRLVVAGGGGGGGEDSPSSNSGGGPGGNAGTSSTTGLSGSGGAGVDTLPGGAGGDSGYSLGGAGSSGTPGAGATECGGSGNAGTPGSGGAGENANYGNSSSGGGGGDGWVGGAGGGAGSGSGGCSFSTGAGGGGGAGLSYVEAGASSVSVTSAGSTIAEVIITAHFAATLSVAAWDPQASAPWNGSEVYGATASATATVSGSPGVTPSGTVTYTFGSGTCAGGSATYGTPATVTLAPDGSVPDAAATGPLDAGSYTVVASYPGDGNYLPASSPCVDFSVGQAPISFTISASPDVQSYGSSLELDTQGLPSDDNGTVTFTDQNQDTLCTVSASGGDVFCDTSSSLPAGDYTASASYTGDPNYSATGEPTTDFSVSQATPGGFSVSVTPGEVTYDSGASITLEADGLPGDATGSVDFTTGGGELCTATNLDGGTATCTYTLGLPAGGYDITATYSGDQNYTSQTADGNLQVDQATPDLSVSVDPGEVTYGSGTKIALEADGFPGGAGGTVDFTADGNELCTVSFAGTVGAISEGVGCSYTLSLPAGGYDVTATYSGDQNDTSQTADGSLQVDQAGTSFTAGAAPASALVGTQVTLSATGLPDDASGSVTFTSGPTTLCIATVSTDGTSCQTPATLGAGIYPVTATYSGDGNYQGSQATTTFTLSAPGGGGASAPSANSYIPLQPFRLCDTRPGAGLACTGSKLGPAESLTLQVTGVGGPQGQSVPAGASAVVLNVTGVQGTAGTFLTVYPTGQALPTASNLNLSAGAIQANLVVASLGSNGQVTIYNARGSIDLVVDVEGYFAPSVSNAGLYHLLTPIRVCDTRSGSGTPCSGHPLGAGQWTRIDVAGTGSVPSDGTAEAVAMNLTATGGTTGTYLGVAPASSSDECPSGAPSFSNLNLGAGATLPNRVIVPLGPAHDVCIYNAQGTQNFVLDANGWFGNGQETSPGAHYYTMTPTRLCDTRGASAVGYTTECSGDTLTTGGTLTVPVSGMAQITGTGSPVAVVANLTAVDGTAGTFFTLYPADQPLPAASDLNPGPGQVVPNLAITKLSSSGALKLYNDQGKVDAVIDVEGWFA
ncbi:MAG TPA: Ig-like domain-containing protein [Candidatus Binatia bacterium]|nr:Ig-like domain-containing protein [Candidatus Binatia bacterium]